MSLLVLLVIVLVILMFVGPGVSYRSPLGIIVGIIVIVILLNLVGAI